MAATFKVFMDVSLRCTVHFIHYFKSFICVDYFVVKKTRILFLLIICVTLAQYDILILLV